MSVIIPTRDRIDLLRKCVASILDVTDYPDYEIIIVDNESSSQEARAWFSEIAADPRMRVLAVPGEFNFSRLNNQAAEVANGEVLALLNNDVEVLDGGWMARLTSFASQEDIGAVGARLLYPNMRVQHGGVILGHGGVAGHAFLGLPATDPGYEHLAVSDRAVSAVTGACLFIKKSLYEEVGGLDEQNLAVSFNDIDLCLRLREKGLCNIYAGSVTLTHHESASRGSEDTPEKKERFLREQRCMEDKWQAQLKYDPFYNPNLVLRDDTYKLVKRSRKRT